MIHAVSSSHVRIPKEQPLGFTRVLFWLQSLTVLIMRLPLWLSCNDKALCNSHWGFLTVFILFECARKSACISHEVCKALNFSEAAAWKVQLFWKRQNPLQTLYSDKFRFEFQTFVNLQYFVDVCGDLKITSQTVTGSELQSVTRKQSKVLKRILNSRSTSISINWSHKPFDAFQDASLELLG